MAICLTGDYNRPNTLLMISGIYTPKFELSCLLMIDRSEKVNIECRYIGQADSNA